MAGTTERSLEELYRDDPERADAVAFGRKAGIGRRGFLGGGAAAMGAAVGGAIPFAANMPGGMIPAALAQPAAAPAAPKGPQYLKFPGKSDKLVVLGEKPLVAETPENLLDDDTTPIDKFFIRNNGLNTEPAKDPDKWTIKIEGEVNKPLEITLGELKSKYKAQTRRMVLECGGNGRSFFSPTARGNQWTNGGAGCAEWTGVRLSDVLKAAQPKPSAIYTANYGADVHLSGDAKRDVLSRGVRLEKAMEANSMIVWAMNGETLPNIHGGPVRLIIPGWPGSVSHKWLTRILLRDKEHDGAGMTEFSYRVPINPMIPGDKGDPKNMRIMELMPVRSIITSPANGGEVAGRHARGEAARRRVGGRESGEPRRCLDRLRRDLAARQSGEAEEQVRLAALDLDLEAAVGRLFRDLDARHRHQAQHAAASGGVLEPAGLRRQCHASRRGAGGLMQWSHPNPPPASGRSRPSSTGYAGEGGCGASHQRFHFS